MNEDQMREKYSNYINSKKKANTVGFGLDFLLPVRTTVPDIDDNMFRDMEEIANTMKQIDFKI